MNAMGGVEDPARQLAMRGALDTAGGRPAVTINARLLPQETNRLFDAFCMTNPHGMRLGLAISRSLIEAHCGRLWAESNRGLGELFSFPPPVAKETVAA